MIPPLVVCSVLPSSVARSVPAASMRFASAHVVPPLVTCPVPPLVTCPALASELPSIHFTGAHVAGNTLAKVAGHAHEVCEELIEGLIERQSRQLIAVDKQNALRRIYLEQVGASTARLYRTSEVQWYSTSRGLYQLVTVSAHGVAACLIGYTGTDRLRNCKLNLCRRGGFEAPAQAVPREELYRH
eukprot:4662796-Pyramimonas_sp.AAC.2